MFSAILKGLGLIRKGQTRGKPARPQPLCKDVLRRAGILADPTVDPRQACIRAKRLIHQGSFRAARDVLLPHAGEVQGADLGLVEELLAICAASGVGGDWAQLCDRSQATYASASDEPAAARVMGLRGEIFVAAGQFEAGEIALATAHDALMAAGDLGGAAVVEALRARLLLRSGEVARAQRAFETVLPTLRTHLQFRAEALARLDRALVFAWLADPAEVARELMRADSLITALPGQHDSLRARLTRAETLIIAGEYRRAASGLHKLVGRAREVEGRDVQARLWLLFGQAVERDDAASARAYFSRSRALYEGLGYDNQVARCDIGLARLEAAMGLDANARLAALLNIPLAPWPLLQAEMRLLRAEVGSAHVRGLPAEQPSRDLLDVRAFGMRTGNIRLVERADAALAQRGTVCAAAKAAVVPLRLQLQSTSPNVEPGAGSPVPLAELSKSELLLRS